MNNKCCICPLAPTLFAKRCGYTCCEDPPRKMDVGISNEQGQGGKKKNYTKIVRPIEIKVKRRKGNAKVGS